MEKESKGAPHGTKLERLALRPAEAADTIGVCRSTIYELLRQGEIGSIKVGRSIRVPVDGLKRWLEAQERRGY